MTVKRRRFDVDTWVERTVRVPGIRPYSMVVDTAATDPVSEAYMAGDGVWINTYLINVMSALTRRGDRVIDVGAFAGEFALAAAARGCRVLAIEANPRLASMVATSAELNRFRRLRVLNVAAGDQSGTVRFYPHGPWGQVVDSAWPDDDDFEPVLQVTLDNVLAALGWTSVAFMKVDIEGSEMRAFAGASGLLRSPNAPALLFESNLSPLSLLGIEPRELLEFVESFGYRLYRVTPTEIISCTSDTFQPEVVCDYLALKRRTPGDYGLKVREPLTPAEAANRVAAECELTSTDHRLVMAWHLMHAPADLLEQPRIQDALQALRNDADERVRQAAAWSAGAQAEAADRAKTRTRASVSVTAAEDARAAAERAVKISTAARREIAERMRRSRRSSAPRS